MHTLDYAAISLQPAVDKAWSVSNLRPNLSILPTRY